jgi:hypothetical protein
MLFLETERLYFRSHEPQDETAFVRMQTDPEVRKPVGGQLWLLEKALTRFRKDYLGHPTEVFGLWATILKSPGSYIGCCGLRASSPDANVFLAFYIAKPFWRQGFGSEAARAFMSLSGDLVCLTSSPKSTPAMRSPSTSCKNLDSHLFRRNLSVRLAGLSVPTSSSALSRPTRNREPDSRHHSVG